jgi:hypothetical protein
MELTCVAGTEAVTVSPCSQPERPGCPLGILQPSVLKLPFHIMTLQTSLAAEVNIEIMILMNLLVTTVF